jgi:branched-chain amino acid transport system ATP-binding protein
MKVLEIRDLHFSIKDTLILNGVGFDVIQGETVGIIGPNGSGKTTLFNCISGFNNPNRGQIKYCGRELTGMAACRRSALGLGRVFQNFGIFKEMTVLENMVTAIESRQPLWSTGLPWLPQNQANQEQAVDYLREVRLEDKVNDKAGSLSGGQMRLLEIIRTLAFGADLFLLDEPTAGVAPKMKEDVATLIGRLQELGKTVLVIEHDINFIQKFCSRIVVLDVGRVVLDDNPDAVRNNELLKEIYFGRDGDQDGADLT